MGSSSAAGKAARKAGGKAAAKPGKKIGGKRAIKAAGGVGAKRAVPAPNPYLRLVLRFRLRRLGSDAELERATAIIDELVERPRLSRGEEEYLDVLSDLVHAYESAAHPIAPASDAEVLRYLMEARGLNQVQLAAEAEIPVSTVSEVLSGKRRLSRASVGTLARFFHVSPAVFSPE